MFYYTKELVAKKGNMDVILNSRENPYILENDDEEK